MKRERPPSGEDVRAGGGQRSAGLRRAADSAVAFRRVSARLRSPELLAVAAAVNGTTSAVQRSRLDQAGAPRFSRVASGRGRIGKPAIRRRHARFHFMAQLYGCNAANGLWVVPGSHRGGKQTSRRWSRQPAQFGCRTRCRDLRGRRCRDLQPAGDSRLVREHQRRRARDDQLRIPSSRRCRRHERRRAQPGCPV